MKLIIATNNEGKLKEFKRILSPLGIQTCSLQDEKAQMEIEETGSTFAENALLKAQAVFQETGLPTIADDSGLCIDALNGRPGVYSARYCGEETPYEEKINRLLEELNGIPKERRTARFICHISCILDADTILECEGSCEGWIGFSPAGSGGFGYDPIFYVGENSYGELSGSDKDMLSHRGIALRKLYSELKQKVK